MIQIKRASELTGVSEATLRIWERRYGLGATHRSDSGYRLYDQADIQALREMQRLLEAGWPAHEAAKAAKSKSENGAADDQFESNGADAVITERFFHAMENLDAVELQRILDEAFAKSSFEYVVDHWLAPTLQELGARWQKGKVNIASEHFASHAIMRRLSAAFESAGQSKNGPKIIIGAPSGSSHEIGTLAFATAVRRLGYPVIYLGVDVPPQSWVEAVEQYGADAVVISVKRAEDVKIVRECLVEIQSKCPNTKIIVGGSSSSEVKDADLVLSGNLTTSCGQLSDFLNQS